MDYTETDAQTAEKKRRPASRPPFNYNQYYFFLAFAFFFAFFFAAM